MTSGVDQMVALHTSSQDDILLCLQGGKLSPKQDRVGELVGTLVDHFTRSVPQQGHDLALVAPLEPRGTNRKCVSMCEEQTNMVFICEEEDGHACH